MKSPHSPVKHLAQRHVRTARATRMGLRAIDRPVRALGRRPCGCASGSVEVADGRRR
jgi:hypothetical protein